MLKYTSWFGSFVLFGERNGQVRTSSMKMLTGAKALKVIL